MSEWLAMLVLTLLPLGIEYWYLPCASSNSQACDPPGSMDDRFATLVLALLLLGIEYSVLHVLAVKQVTHQGL